MRIYAIDPGSVQSALLIIETKPFKITYKEILPNEQMVSVIENIGKMDEDAVLAIEYLQSYGQKIGRDVLDTAFWVGFFCHAWGGKFTKHLRTRIKNHIIGSVAGNDADVKRALKMRFGEPGTKKNKGILYGISRDLWSALAVAVYHMDGSVLGDW